MMDTYLVSVLQGDQLSLSYLPSQGLKEAAHIIWKAKFEER